MLLPVSLVLALFATVPGSGAPFVVALDPGHGGTNLGARGISPEIYEKHITLAIAERVRAHLQADPGVRVVLCRQRDELVPIRARVRCANDAHADLFVSIHANASLLQGSQEGFELYVLPVESADQVAALAAARAETPAEAVWALHRNREIIALGLEAAKRIQWELGDARGRDRDRGIKQDWAALDVLQGLHMPGVLIEVGYVDHKNEGAELASPAGQETIGRALARALSDLAARARRAQSDPAITFRKSAVRGKRR